jgi:hypothetical protein
MSKEEKMGRPIPRRNPVARALPAHKPKIVPDKTKYTRKGRKS